MDEQNNTFKKIVIGVSIGVISGIILGIGAATIHFGNQITRLEERIDGKKIQNVHQVTNSPVDSLNGDPNELIILIKVKQKQYVRESSGEEKSQCFTKDDSIKFVENKTIYRIITELKNNNKYIQTVIAIKRMDPARRQDLLESCSKISKRTWEEIGYITSEGQTVAGKNAELMIAGAIVDNVKELIKKPVEDLERLYR